MDVLIEINVAGEISKSGILYDEAFEFAHKISELDNISVKGIMAIPPVFEKESISRGYFEKLYKIYIDIKSKKIDNIYMHELSMGMSDDYEEAVRSGATVVRVGRTIFGSRL